MRWIFFTTVIAAALIAVGGAQSTGLVLPMADSARPAMEARLGTLQLELKRLANNTPGLVAITVSDAGGRMPISVNGDWNLPAASVIKVPVMVEVMRQASLGRFSLDREVTLTAQDIDCGSGALCDAGVGMTFSVRNLMRIMIDNSDNTATNMLIRLVGRENINDTMTGLGLTQTRLGDSIHVYERGIRSLRTSTNDMMRLLVMIAGRRLVNEQASDLMLSILEEQRHNDLMPKPLPKGLIIAHKTGTLHDTLNDVGIVDLEGSPYIVCVITTHLEDLDDGARLIRRVSKATYETFAAAQADEATPLAPAPTPTDSADDLLTAPATAPQ
jgi:beta-lactamase class A